MNEHQTLPYAVEAALRDRTRIDLLDWKLNQPTPRAGELWADHFEPDYVLAILGCQGGMVSYLRPDQKVGSMTVRALFGSYDFAGES